MARDSSGAEDLERRRRRWMRWRWRRRRKWKMRRKRRWRRWRMVVKGMAEKEKEPDRIDTKKSVGTGGHDDVPPMNCNGKSETIVTMLRWSLKNWGGRKRMR
jgi:hypothetical protein